MRWSGVAVPEGLPLLVRVAVAPDRRRQTPKPSPRYLAALPVPGTWNSWVGEDLASVRGGRGEPRMAGASVIDRASGNLGDSDHAATTPPFRTRTDHRPPPPALAAARISSFPRPMNWQGSNALGIPSFPHPWGSGLPVAGVLSGCRPTEVSHRPLWGLYPRPRTEGREKGMHRGTFLAMRRTYISRTIRASDAASGG